MLEVDRSILLEFSEGGKELIATHSWAREGFPRFTGILVSEELPWYTGTLLRGETVACSRLLEDLPEEAMREREYSARVGFRSNLMIPLNVSGRPLAVLSIGSFRRERAWPEEIIPGSALILPIRPVMIACGLRLHILPGKRDEGDRIRPEKGETPWDTHL
jgi:GAF domain-containing protein